MMQRESLLKRIKKDIEGLSPEEQSELIEILMFNLKKKRTVAKDSADWDNLYGLGKGLWREDAQKYVSSLREDRI